MQRIEIQLYNSFDLRHKPFCGCLWSISLNWSSLILIWFVNQFWDTIYDFYFNKKEQWSFPIPVTTHPEVYNQAQTPLWTKEQIRLAVCTTTSLAVSLSVLTAIFQVNLG